jgi:methionyl-tRNA synthetase
MRSYQLHLYIAAVMEAVGAANRYFANAEPWKLAKTDPAGMRRVLYVTLETLRIAAILLQPVMPGAMTKLLDLLAVSGDKRRFADAEAASGGLDAPRRLPVGVPLPAPQVIFPRYVES